MGVADRVLRRQRQMDSQQGQATGESQTDSPFTSLVRADRPDITRLKSVVHVLENIIRTNGDGMYARLSFFMSTITDELANELEELDELQVRLFLYQIGEVIAWIGHGDNERLPEAVREFAEEVQPSAHIDHAETNAHIESGTETG